MDNYTIVSFASVSYQFIDTFISEHNRNIKFIDALNDIYNLVLSHKSQLSENIIINENYRYLTNEEDIKYLNDVIEIEKLLKKYVIENDRIVIIHSYANEYDESIAMKLCKEVINNNKECINVFVIPFTFTGKTELFIQHRDELLKTSAKNYYFDCNDLRKKIPSNLSLFQTNDIVYKALFEIAYSIDTDFQINDILDKELKKVCKEVEEPKYCIYNDNEFGEIKFIPQEIDTPVICKKFNFGKYNPDISVIDFNEKDIEIYAKTLKKVYKMKDKIIDELFKFTLNICQVWEEKDQYGNEITMEYILKYFNISFIQLYDVEGAFCVSGYLSSDYEDACLLGEHSIQAYINNHDDAIYCNLVG